MLDPTQLSWAVISHARPHSPHTDALILPDSGPTLGHCGSSHSGPQHRRLPCSALPKSFRTEMSRREEKRKGEEEEEGEMSRHFNRLVDTFA